MAGQPKTRAALATLETVGIDDICERYASGLTIRALADELDVSKSVLHRFVERGEHADKWSAAKKAHAARLAEECIEIADAGRSDTYTDDNGNTRTDHEVVNRSKLRVETRKWFASKLDPDTYGEQKSGGVTVNFNSVHLDVLRSLRPAPVSALIEGEKQG